jgi:hypothetical protein
MRYTTPLVRLTAASAFVAAGLLPSAAVADPAVPTPPDTGCPAGWQLLNLQEMHQQGYQFTVHPDADGDGFFCGKPVAPAVQAMICETFPGGVCPVPIIYYLRDNNVTRR